MPIPQSVTVTRVLHSGPYRRNALKIIEYHFLQTPQRGLRDAVCGTRVNKSPQLIQLAA